MRHRKPALVGAKEDLEQYRSYLRALADMQLDPRLRAKEDVSDIPASDHDENRG